jgi:hypothetical protein
MTAAETIIEKFGGRQELANVLGVNISQTYRWTYPKSQSGGTGGAIPSRHFPKLLKAAKARGISIDPAELIGAD